jgi:hypothetical protein
MPDSQFHYIEVLDRRIKIAASTYLVMILGGTALILYGIERMSMDLATRQLKIPFIFASCLLVVFFALFYGVGKIRWITELHSWMDRRFFRLLDKSDLILFEGLIVALEPEERQGASDLQAMRRETVAKSVFAGLATDNSLSNHLFHTGIFRMWIWYWIAMYGTFAFSLLTVESFSLMLRGVDQYGRLAFEVCWLSAVGHLLVGVVLGYRLLGLMEHISRILVMSHRDEIAAMLRKNLMEEVDTDS